MNYQCRCRCVVAKQMQMDPLTQIQNHTFCSVTRFYIIVIFNHLTTQPGSRTRNEMWSLPHNGNYIDAEVLLKDYVKI